MEYNIEEIIQLTKTNSTNYVIGKRNSIKIVDYLNKKLSIKVFKVPNFINGFIYRFIRKSKAKRSYENAIYLESKNIGTPKPIGFYENKNAFQLLDTYYICEHVNADYVFKDLFQLDLEYTRNIYKQFAHFCFKIHEAGIEFLDHSPGNTLILKKENGFYEFLLIDLNRMKFHKEMTIDQRMKNLNRLVPNETILRIISDEYAFHYNKNEEELFSKLLYYTNKFFKKSDRKKKFKKLIKIR